MDIVFSEYIVSLGDKLFCNLLLFVTSELLEESFDMASISSLMVLLGDKIASLGRLELSRILPWSFLFSIHLSLEVELFERNCGIGDIFMDKGSRWVLLS